MKNLLLVGAALFMLSFAPVQIANAQTSDNDSTQQVRPQRGQRGDRQQMDPAKMAERQTQQMVKKYGLNDEQAKALLALNTETMKARQTQRKDFDPRNMTDDQRTAFVKQMKDQQTKYETALKKIMTADQYKAYEKAQKQRQLRQRQQMENGEGGPQGGPGEGGQGGPGQGGPGMGGGDM